MVFFLSVLMANSYIQCSSNLRKSPHWDQGFNLKLNSWTEKGPWCWDLNQSQSKILIPKVLPLSRIKRRDSRNPRRLGLWPDPILLIPKWLFRLVEGSDWPSGRRQQGQGLRSAAAVFHEYTLLPPLLLQLYTLYFTFFCISWMHSHDCSCVLPEIHICAAFFQLKSFKVQINGKL